MIQVYNNDGIDGSVLYRLQKDVNPHYVISNYLPIFEIKKIEWKTKNLCYVYCSYTTFVFSKKLF